MFIIVNLQPRSVEKRVSPIFETKSQTLSNLQFLVHHPVAKPSERPLASTIANIQPRSKVSRAFTTETLSPKVSCRRMTFGELCSTNLYKDDFLDRFANP